MVSSGLAEGSRWPERPCWAQWWAPSCRPGVQAGTVLVHGQHIGPGQSRGGETPNSHPCMGKVGACAWPASQKRGSHGSLTSAGTASRQERLKRVGPLSMHIVLLEKTLLDSTFCSREYFTWDLQTGFCRKPGIPIRSLHWGNPPSPGASLKGTAGKRWSVLWGWRRVACCCPLLHGHSISWGVTG